MVAEDVGPVVVGRRDVRQKPPEARKNGIAAGLAECHDDDSAVARVKMRNRVVEIAVGCQQYGPKGLRRRENILVGGAASASFLKREHLVSAFPQERHGRKGKVFVEEKPHAGAGS